MLSPLKASGRPLDLLEVGSWEGRSSAFLLSYLPTARLATGAGVNFTFDNGKTWLLYNSDNGLVGDNISAIFAHNNRLWLGANHEETFDNSPITVSDGLLYTDDLGDNWFKYDFDALGLDKIYGFQRYVYDITGHHNNALNEDWMFFSAWRMRYN